MISNSSPVPGNRSQDKRTLQWLVIFTLITLLCGCSSEAFRRMAYTLGTSYSCTRSNDHLPNETVKDLKCSNPVTSNEMSYEEYQKQREQLLRHKD